MAKFIKVPVSESDFQWQFECPGCECNHAIFTTTHPSRNLHPMWKFNGDVNNPTVIPSINISSQNKDGPTRCHSVVIDGNIKFEGDCTHALVGQTVPLPDVF